MTTENIMAKKIKTKMEWFNKIADINSDTFNDTRQKAFDLQLAARQNLDKWIFSIITLSSAIFGVSISSLLGKSVIVNKSLLYAGLLLFSLNVIVGIWKLKRKIENDVDGMAKTQEFLNDLIYGGVDEARGKIIESINDDEMCDKIAVQFIENRKAKLKAKNISYEKDKDKKDYTADILFYIFLVAVILVFGSMAFSLQELWKFIENIWQTLSLWLFSL